MTANRTEFALIVAGGKGTRIKSSIPKQFLELNGLPVLMHTINAFYQYSAQITIILVLPEEDLETWESLCKKHRFNKPFIVQSGGETRFQSVKRGLEKVGDGLVAIHDGVRPLVTEPVIRASFQLAGTHQSAVAAVPLKDSVRITDGDGTRAVDRSQYCLVQTPQTFETGLIKKAYQIKEEATLTDDASVVERFGHAISLFEGSYENIKITTAEDLTVAEALLKRKSQPLG
jgi:2-C-methyl-D-erythritol 4-phosphate cytidylyltransferase